MSAAGVNISERTIRFAELIRKGEHLELGRFGEREIPQGAVEGGDIKEPLILSNLLSQIKKENNFSFVRVALPEQQAYLITLKIPRIKKSAIRGSIELQLEEHVPINPNNVIFDYTIAPHEKNDQHFKVGISVIQSKIVEMYHRVFNDAGLIPLSFEIEAQAIVRALLSPSDQDTYLLIDIGARRTGLMIVSEGIIRFTWTVQIGGDLLTQAVAQTERLDFEKARAIKEKIGLYRNKEKNLVHILTPLLKILRNEIGSRFEYWQLHRDEVTGGEHPPIEKVIFCGGETNVPGLPQFLSTGFKVPFLIANPWKNVVSFDQYIPKIPFNHSLRYTTALGLALRFPE